MAGETQDSTWPLPKFYFNVKFGEGDSIAFQEVTGLESESQAVEYRHKNTHVAYPIKIPVWAKWAT